MNIQEMHSWFDVLQDKGDSPYFTVAEKTQFLNRAQVKFVNDVLFKHYFATGTAPEGNAIPYNSMNSIQSAEDILAALITELQTTRNHRKSYYPNNGSGNSQFTPSLDEDGRFNMFQLNLYVQGMLKDRQNSQYDAYTWNKAHVLHILNLSWSAWNEISFRYVRRSDARKMMSNSFKGPTIEDPVFYIMKGGTGTARSHGIYQIQPTARPDGVGFYTAYGSGAYTNYDPTGNGNTTVPSDILPSSGTYTPPGAQHGGFYGNRLMVTVVRSPLEMNYDPLTFTTTPTNSQAGGNQNVNCELPSWTHDDIMAIALEDAGVASRDEALMKLSTASKANIGSPKYSTERTGQK